LFTIDVRVRKAFTRMIPSTWNKLIESHVR
jgi:hypothetical protein